MKVALLTANHGNFDNVVRDIVEWSRKVKKGGVISGHDYDTGLGVREAVNAYVKCHRYHLRLTAEADDNAISWWFLKKWSS